MELRKYIREMVETELSELARISTNIKIGDAAKAEAAKKLLSGTWLEDMLDIVMAAGEVGIPQPDLARKLGKTSQQAINPKVNSFLDSGVFAKGELSVPKKEKPESNGVKGRPTSEKVLMAKSLNSKLEADSDYEPNEEELEVLGSEFIEKLRMRVMGTLKRGRKLGASTAKDGMMAAMKNVMDTSDGDGDGDIDDEDLDLVSENESNENYNIQPIKSILSSNISSEEKMNKIGTYLTDTEDGLELSNTDLGNIIDKWFNTKKDASKWLNQVQYLINNPEELKNIEDDLYENNSLNESFTRMQKIAGLIK